jgi:hypothetical protein
VSEAVWLTEGRWMRMMAGGSMHFVPSITVISVPVFALLGAVR